MRINYVIISLAMVILGSLHGSHVVQCASGTLHLKKTDFVCVVDMVHHYRRIREDLVLPSLHKTHVTGPGPLNKIILSESLFICNHVSGEGKILRHGDKNRGLGQTKVGKRIQFFPIAHIIYAEILCSITLKIGWFIKRKRLPLAAFAS